MSARLYSSKATCRLGVQAQRRKPVVPVPLGPQRRWPSFRNSGSTTKRMRCEGMPHAVHAQPRHSHRWRKQTARLCVNRHEHAHTRTRASRTHTYTHVRTCTLCEDTCAKTDWRENGRACHGHKYACWTGGRLSLKDIKSSEQVRTPTCMAHLEQACTWMYVSIA